MMTMETIEIVMLLHCLVSRDNLLGDTFAVQCPCHSHLCSVPLMMMMMTTIMMNWWWRWINTVLAMITSMMGSVLLNDGDGVDDYDSVGNIISRPNGHRRLARDTTFFIAGPSWLSFDTHRVSGNLKCRVYPTFQVNPIAWVFQT